jgi:Domain of unknown function (DUF4124)
MNKLLLTAGLAISCSIAYAQNGGKASSTTIYKLVDENGKVTYSNLPIKGAVKLDLEPLTSIPAPALRTATATVSTTTAALSPVTFPNVDGATQKRRDEIRRKILDEEMRQEEKLLADARSAAQDEENGRTEVIRTMRVAAEKQNVAASLEARRAFEQREDQLKSLNETVTAHEKNIESLKKELAALK